MPFSSYIGNLCVRVHDTQAFRYSNASSFMISCEFRSRLQCFPINTHIKQAVSEMGRTQQVL